MTYNSSSSTSPTSISLDSLTLISKLKSPGSINHKFTRDNFNPKLGCHLYWIKGNPRKYIREIYSMSIFQTYSRETGYNLDHSQKYHKYAQYLELSVINILTTRDVYIRLYVDNSLFTKINPDSHIWENILNLLSQFSRVQIVAVKFPQYYSESTHSHQGLLAVMFRYLALFDPNVNICHFRDIDNIWNNQHNYFVEKWLGVGANISSDSIDVLLFLNSNYKRQQIESFDIFSGNVILENKFYNTLFSGFWSIRKRGADGEEGILPIYIWHYMFAYMESYTDFVNFEKYRELRYYGFRFLYGFDELVLSRITIPILLERYTETRISSIPIRVYNKEYFEELFQPELNKLYMSMFSGGLSEKNTIREIIVNRYWDMSSPTSGLAQYLLYIISNIYYRIITGQSFIKSIQIINILKYKVYPVPFLMSVGFFVFHNFFKYSIEKADRIVKKYTQSGISFSLQDIEITTLEDFIPYWPAGSDSNFGYTDY
jgi:hypothetical protein